MVMRKSRIMLQFTLELEKTDQQQGEEEAPSVTFLGLWNEKWGSH
jgi:hypothetical protein